MKQKTKKKQFFVMFFPEPTVPSYHHDCQVWHHTQTTSTFVAPSPWLSAGSCRISGPCKASLQSSASAHTGLGESELLLPLAEQHSVIGDDIFPELLHLLTPALPKHQTQWNLCVQPPFSSSTSLSIQWKLSDQINGPHTMTWQFGSFQYWDNFSTLL